MAKDPRLVWLYTGLAGTAAIAGVVFHWMFKGLDEREVARPVESAEDEIELISRKSDEGEGSSDVRDA
jgi:hypothetical protein